jgi:hypothetical protein
LINDAQQVLTDPQAKSDNYNQISTQLANSITEAQQKFQPLLDSNSEQFSELNRLIEMARISQKNLEDMDNNLKAFLAQRDVVNELLDVENEKLNAISDRDLRPVDDAQNDIEELKVRSASVFINF